jgi:hypothetical protein
LTAREQELGDGVDRRLHVARSNEGGGVPVRPVTSLSRPLAPPRTIVRSRGRDYRLSLVIQGVAWFREIRKVEQPGRCRLAQDGRDRAVGNNRAMPTRVVPLRSVMPHELMP